VKEDLRLRFDLLINEMNADQRWLALQRLVQRCNKDAGRELLARGWKVSVVASAPDTSSKPDADRGGQR